MSGIPARPLADNPVPTPQEGGLPSPPPRSLAAQERGLPSPPTETARFLTRLHTLMERYQAAGGHIFDGHKPSAEEQRLRHELQLLYPDYERLLREADEAVRARLRPYRQLLRLDCGLPCV